MKTTNQQQGAALNLTPAEAAKVAREIAKPMHELGRISLNTAAAFVAAAETYPAILDVLNAAELVNEYGETVTVVRDDQRGAMLYLKSEKRGGCK